MRLMLAEPFKSLWAGRDAFAAEHQGFHGVVPASFFKFDGTVQMVQQGPFFFHQGLIQEINIFSF